MDSGGFRVHFTCGCVACCRLVCGPRTLPKRPCAPIYRGKPSVRGRLPAASGSALGSPLPRFHTRPTEHSTYTAHNSSVIDGRNSTFTSPNVHLVKSHRLMLPSLTVHDLPTVGPSPTRDVTRGRPIRAQQTTSAHPPDFVYISKLRCRSLSLEASFSPHYLLPNKFNPERR